MQLTISSTEPGEQLWRAVRAGFELQGSSLGRWCTAHRIASTWAGHALKGRRNGPATRRLRMRLIRAAGLVCRS